MIQIIDIRIDLFKKQDNKIIINIKHYFEEDY